MLKGVEELNVQPGDEVCFMPHYPKNDLRFAEILTVVKVTPGARQITTTDGRRFDKDGFEIGATVSQSGSRNGICPLTPDLRARIQHAQDQEYITRYLEVNKLSKEAASAIVAIMKGEPRQGDELEAYIAMLTGPGQNREQVIRAMLMGAMRFMQARDGEMR